MNETETIRQRLEQGLPAATYTRGVSMRPLLYQGKTHVILEPLSRELHPGELPIYLRPDGVYVIHRLIRIEENCYYTRGDNCMHGEKIPKDWVIGVVTEIYRKGKNIPVTSRGYRIYVAVWNAIFPLRWVYYFARKCAKWLWARIKRHEKE